MIHFIAWYVMFRLFFKLMLQMNELLAFMGLHFAINYVQCVKTSLFAYFIGFGGKTSSGWWCFLGRVGLKLNSARWHSNCSSCCPQIITMPTSKLGSLLAKLIPKRRPKLEISTPTLLVLIALCDGSANAIIIMDFLSTT